VTPDKQKILEEKRRLLQEKKNYLAQVLPHLHGFKWYEWAWKFFNHTNHMGLLCAANQISKSSTAIRKNIHRATDTALWPKLWPKNPHPRQFWYLYPDKNVATSEFQSKWVPEFMPKTGMFDKTPQREKNVCAKYGWRAYYDKKRIDYVEFTNGLRIYFKTYAQDVHSLQSSSPHMITCFTAGTLIMSEYGPKPIEELTVGDMVWSHKGWRPIVKTFQHVAPVVTREFDDGTEITATLDHPFLVEGIGWKDFSQLTHEDVCGKLPGWKILEKLYYLKVGLTRAFRKAMTSVHETISVAGEGNFCMSLCGSSSMDGRSLRGTSSTTATLLRSTTVSKISSACRVGSTPESISCMSGSSLGTTNESAKSAGKCSRLAVLRRLLLGTVLKLADVSGKIAPALFAKRFSALDRTYPPGRVRQSADNPSSQITVTEKPVYNIEVDISHTYFSQGYQVHNCDEELPEDLYSELQARLFATNGYFDMVFTATKNQEMWWRAIEGEGEQELFPDAFKLQVTMYDCLKYNDGTPGHFTTKRIDKIIESCKSPTEVDRRVKGRFVTEIGRKYPAFDPRRHYVKPFALPKNCKFYAGIDIGSGGQGGHPSAICFIAVDPEYRKGWVYKGWRGDGIPTTAGDTFMKFIEMRGGTNMTLQLYDQACRDFYTIASRAGESFQGSEKSHDLGEQIINSLFANNMLYLFDTPEIRKLGGEFMRLLLDTPKKQAKDDFADACRYTAVMIPWDWTAIKDLPTDDVIVQEAKVAKTIREIEEWEIKMRRGEDPSRTKDQAWAEHDADIQFWNDEYGT
jgi:hypothetical protein